MIVVVRGTYKSTSVWIHTWAAVVLTGDSICATSVPLGSCFSNQGAWETLRDCQVVLPILPQRRCAANRLTHLRSMRICHDGLLHPVRRDATTAWAHCDTTTPGAHDVFHCTYRAIRHTHPCTPTHTPTPHSYARPPEHTDRVWTR